jgi:hypothetical protein
LTAVDAASGEPDLHCASLFPVLSLKTPMKYRALLLLVLLPFSTAALAQDTVAPPTNQRFLIQVTAGQDDPTKSALAFLVAKTALEADLAGKPAAFATPSVLVKLASEADKVLVY